ncbi:hypothetical protein PFISCL1PPCAC_27897 [Pristionchus fissidentatus]|uniref:Neurotransmitter-gated ion-channel ligand-binding domain-containing protein n=1 Tax=Pristionchus fissidentatus TaxID=1538716 RepID=A0AAV5X106_9BILA|nr:hypothetical protein PFISCL1PPCAC_27897 [Pristionchus fissidentatus]
MGIVLALLVILTIGSYSGAVDSEQEILDQLYGYLEMVHFPDAKDGLRDSKQTFEAEQILMSDIFGPTKYDRNVIPKGEGGLSLSIKPTVRIDHIEPLEEDEEAMTVHGSVTFEWKDGGVKWTPSDHHEISVISRRIGDFPMSSRVWTPVIYFKSAEPSDVRRSDGIELQSTTLTITHKGEVVLQRPFSVKTQCNFDFRDFPYDQQHCKLAITSTHSMFDVFFDFDIRNEDQIVRQLRKDKMAPTIGDFVLVWVSAFNAVIKSDLKLEILAKPWNGTEKDQLRAQTKVALFIEMTFERIDDKYFFLFNVPLLIVVVMAQGAACFDTKKGFLFLGAAFLLLTNQGGLIAEKFPSNDDGTPLIAFMYYLAFAHMMECLIGMFALAYYFGNREGVTTIRRPAPAKYIMDEMWARTVYFSVTGLTLAIIVYGTLFVRSWRHFDLRA